MHSCVGVTTTETVDLNLKSAYVDISGSINKWTYIRSRKKGRLEHCDTFMECQSNDMFSENQSCQYGGLINCQILEGSVLPALIFQAR
jgi:hypothetical protein